jgi:hypothetical protein
MACTRGLDLPALASACEQLARRVDALGSGDEELAAQRLALDLEAAEARLAGAPDALTAEAHEQEISAIRGRLEATRGAGATRARLLARQRALLHQLATLRTSAAQALASEAPGDLDALAEQAAALRDSIAADLEVEESLARQRRAQAAGRAGRL